MKGKSSQTLQTVRTTELGYNPLTHDNPTLIPEILQSTADTSESCDSR